MSPLYYHIVDIAHGIVMAILLFFIFRLLIFRKEGYLRLRYLAVTMLILAIGQVVLYSLGEFTGDRRAYEYLSIGTDAVAALGGLGGLWLFYRNRHIYPASILFTGSTTLIAIMLCYLICALLAFEEWTYCIYLIVSTVGWAIFCLTVERLPESPQGTDMQPQNAPQDQWSKFRQELDRVMRQDNLFCNEDLTREDVCKAMRTNRTTFSRQLKQAYDKTFSEYLRDMRLQEAARLLRETDIPVDQITFSVGLKSASGFHRNFLLSYGQTPAQYRRQ